MTVPSSKSLLSDPSSYSSLVAEDIVYVHEPSTLAKSEFNHHRFTESRKVTKDQSSLNNNINVKPPQTIYSIDILVKAPPCVIQGRAINFLVDRIETYSDKFCKC